ncbi:sugar phosphate isomerase/epimerase [Protaetiibacter sp. SSC-01]|uniref:sugar phosphate isomerase/epimerase family protein n=1 Tax=Protaetiibacter sp. SSC-01 TaxID=2759943 RepID=UPI001656EC46|nr:TIM barrel protein [Protaetiibacter sp. SSC-01]QNO37049.1 sugar phosphate isomerase/epimerase [Protaetiibacter sp. SSC-01]
MRLAISNIAWPAEEEADVAAALQAADVTEVEIAPTKTFTDPLATSETERAEYLGFWADHGIRVSAFQSMLFGRLDLEVFGSPQVREQTARYLEGFIELAGQLGAERMVFGSPKNRRVPEGMDLQEAHAIAEEFFRGLGRVAVDHGTVFCIEPNPTAYDCNYVVNAQQGIELVARVDHPGFGLHLDAAGMTLAGDDVGASVRAAGGLLRHFHASAPYLGALEDTEVDHASAASALAAIGYTGAVSIEMRPGDAGEGPARAAAAVELARRYYAG